MERQQLIQEITNAFNSVDPPEEQTLHVAQAHAYYDDAHDADHRKKDFTGPWQEVPVSHIQECQDALAFLDKTGMRYYLPAFMVWYLQNLETEHITTDNTLYVLGSNTNDPELANYHQERFSLFTPEQLHACAQFVRFCANDTTKSTDSTFAQNIYNTYWSQFNRD